jgi:hypothetical protein
VVAGPGGGAVTLCPVASSTDPVASLPAPREEVARMGTEVSHTRRFGGPWWVWVIVVLCALMVIVYLVLDALAGTHGV